MAPVPDLPGGQSLLTHLAQEGFVNLVEVEHPDLALVHPANLHLLDLGGLQQVVQDDAPHTAGASQFFAPVKDALVTRRNRLLLLVPADVIKDLCG